MSNNKELFVRFFEGLMIQHNIVNQANLTKQIFSGQNIPTILQDGTVSFIIKNNESLTLGSPVQIVYDTQQNPPRPIQESFIDRVKQEWQIDIVAYNKPQSSLNDAVTISQRFNSIINSNKTYEFRVNNFSNIISIDRAFRMIPLTTLETAQNFRRFAVIVNIIIEISNNYDIYSYDSVATQIFTQN
jgi:hypothetical protein